MSASDQEQPWFAVQTRSCGEKTVATLLQYKGYECFLPVGKSKRRWSDRMKELEVPLFPGYLFCRFDIHNRLPVLKTPGVIQIVGSGKTPIPVDEGEIAAIQRVGKSGLAARPCPFLRVGNVVRIENGPLSGLSGIVANIKSEARLVLSVTLLRRSVAVEVDRDWLGVPSALERVGHAIESGRSSSLGLTQPEVRRTVGLSSPKSTWATHRNVRMVQAENGGLNAS